MNNNELKEFNGQNELNNNQPTGLATMHMDLSTKLANGKTYAETILFENENSTTKYDIEFYKTFLESHGLSTFNDPHCLTSEGVGIIPIVGEIGFTFLDTYEANYGAIRESLAALEGDEKCKAILFLINSPGGYANGMFNTAERIKKCAKPTYAFISLQGCSAAYGLASACQKIAIESDSLTASIGCIGTARKYDEGFVKRNFGFITKVFKSKNAPHKCESPFDSEEAEAKYQAEIDALGDKFLSMVAENRGVDIEEAKTTFGMGAVYSVEEALATNMVDECVNFTDYYAEIVSALSTETDEGEGEEDMDIETMSAEQRQELFSKLCSAEPSLLEEVKKGERQRVSELNALRTNSERVNALVDEALASGKSAESIGLSVAKTMMAEKEEKDAENRERLQNLASATTDVPVAMEKTEDAERNTLVEKTNSRRAK